MLETAVRVEVWFGIFKINRVLRFYEILIN